MVSVLTSVHAPEQRDLTFAPIKHKVTQDVREAILAVLVLDSRLEQQ
jgi:hypothetical protein